VSNLADLTLYHAALSRTLTLRSAKVERVLDNGIDSVGIPDMQSSAAPVIGLINMKNFKNAITITGYIVQEAVDDPTTQMQQLYQMSYDTRNIVVVTWRGVAYNGYIKKINIVDTLSDDLSNLKVGEVGYDVMLLFLEGEDFANI
jgi:hypothetical protein